VVLFTVALYHWLGPQSEWLITASKKQEAASLGLPDRYGMRPVSTFLAVSLPLAQCTRWQED
jgi:hypothetical protein